MKLPFYLALMGIMVSVNVHAAEDNRNEWALQPLGDPVPAVGKKAVPVRKELISSYKGIVDTKSPFLKDANSLASCLLVIPKGANPSVMKAAQTLQKIFHAITGQEVGIASESTVMDVPEGSDALVMDKDGKKYKFPIWVGNTDAAAGVGVTADDLKAGGFRIATTKAGMMLVGNDKGDLGTYYAALSLLERHLGVRWLWPGEVGTVLPPQSQFSLPSITEQDEPALAQREIRSLGYIPTRSDIGMKLLGVTKEQVMESYKDVSEWSHEQRLGGAFHIYAGHAFGDWYKKYGKEHPDWFALQPDGTRVQIGGREQLCMSNPGVVKAAAEQALEFLKNHPGVLSASISPNDGGAHNFFCMCPECRKLDPPNGPKISLLFGYGENRQKNYNADYVSLTDRTVTFYNHIAEQVVKEMPEAKLGVYAYSAYRDPPLGAPLHPSIIAGFVGLGYYNEASRHEDIKRWDGWASKASQLYLRPNFLLSGRGIPAVYVHRMGEDIKHCYQTGMIATDFDGMIQNWGTNGLNYYVLARLLWDPSLNVDALVQDYCERGFGPAAPAILNYFNALEAATLHLAEVVGPTGNDKDALREGEIDTIQRTARERLSHAFAVAYDKATLAKLRGFLNQAQAAAGEDKTVQNRITFLKDGLEFGEKQVACYRELESGGDAAPELEALLEYYRRIFHENPLVINTTYRGYEDNAAFRILKNR